MNETQALGIIRVSERVESADIESKCKQRLFELIGVDVRSSVRGSFQEIHGYNELLTNAAESCTLKAEFDYRPV